MSYVTPEGARLTRDEIMNIAHLFVIAGLDTVTASLTCIVGWLARHPDVQQRVMDDPSLLPATIEELMRFENPVMTSGARIATEDTEVNGVPVHAGDRVTLCWATANLDPEAFADPLDVDIQRQGNRHIAFAAGRHRCLGSHLARLELPRRHRRASPPGVAVLDHRGRRAALQPPRRARRGTPPAFVRAALTRQDGWSSASSWPSPRPRAGDRDEATVERPDQACAYPSRPRIRRTGVYSITTSPRWLNTVLRAVTTPAPAAARHRATR